MTEILLVPNRESKMTEPLPIPVQQSTSISDPLQGYLDFVAMFKIIRMQHEDNGMNFKKLIPIYGFEADRMFGFNLNTHSYNALSAIRPLLLTQNNNSDRLILEIEREFDSLRKWFDNVIEGSPVLKNSKEHNDDELQLYFQRLSDEEKDEYRLYNRLARPFYDFFSAFRDLVSPPKKRTDFTHRENALAHLLRVEFEGEEPIQRKMQKPKKFEQAFDSLNSKTRSKTNPFREPTQDELIKVISLLKDSPKALEEARKRLQKLVESKH